MPYICGSEKYHLGGSKVDTIVLPVFPAGLPEKIEVEGYTLFLKTEFHVSVVCMGKIIEKHGVTIPDFINKVANDFCEFTKDKNIDLLRYRDEFRFSAQNERRSVVAMCDVMNLPEFFELMNRKYQRKIEYPPTHVTLYTLQPNVGIFLVDSKDIQTLTKPIPNPGVVLN